MTCDPTPDQAWRSLSRVHRGRGRVQGRVSRPLAGSPVRPVRTEVMGVSGPSSGLPVRSVCPEAKGVGRDRSEVGRAYVQEGRSSRDVCTEVQGRVQGRVKDLPSNTAASFERSPEKEDLLLSGRHGLKAPIAQHANDRAPPEGQGRSRTLRVDVGMQLSQCRGTRRCGREVRQGPSCTWVSLGGSCPQRGHRTPGAHTTT